MPEVDRENTIDRGLETSHQLQMVYDAYRCEGLQKKVEELKNQLKGKEDAE